MGKGTGPNDGHVIDISDPGMVEGWMAGFGVDSAGLKSKHRAWLDDRVVPVLRAGGSVAITGMTSRSGSATHNLALSKRRAGAVLAYLRQHARRHFTVRSLTGQGEWMSEANLRKDGTEEWFYRAVIVASWPSPAPPPAPNPTRVTQRLSRRRGVLA